MLSKGTELFMYEGDLFKLKQSWINREMNDDSWKQLMVEGNALLHKYNFANEMLDYYCFQEFSTFVDFLDRKTEGKYGYDVRKGLLELQT